MTGINAIEIIEAISILGEKKTIGSGPLEVLGADGNLYYAKTSILSRPRVELINEIFYAYAAKFCDIKVPDFCLISISQELFEEHNKYNVPLSNRYSTNNFQHLFFGSCIIPNSTELENFHQQILNKHEYNRFSNPLDFYKIGILDFWLCNKDRKPSNPNILISEQDSLFHIHPIDHTASFGFSSSYLDLNPAYLFLPDNFRILSCNYIKSIGKFADGKKLTELKNIMLSNFILILNNFDFICQQIPQEFGFNNRAKAKIKLVLQDNSRNNKCAISYQSYIQ